MPTYQYSCTHCGHFFEVFQSFNEDSLTVCPECEGQLRKVFNAVGVVFKGSGFYRNDSRGKHATGDPAAAAKTPASTSGASEAKPSGTPATAGATKASPAASTGGSTSAG